MSEGGSNGAPYVGVAAGGLADATSSDPMIIDAKEVKPKEIAHVLSELNDAQRIKLYSYLTSRLAAGVIARDRRTNRMGKIDRLISTWQKLNPADSERERNEDNTGRQAALPMNLPVLASSLDDMVSYFAEALAPVANPFFSAGGDSNVSELLKKFNRDARARDYFSELSLTLRSLIKYNIGGFRLRWDDGMRFGRKVGEPGNLWKSLDPYNTMWDPSVRNPSDVARKGEWAATVELENRLTIMQHVIAGDWVGLDDIVCKGIESSRRSKYYKEPAIEAGLSDPGMDARSSGGKGDGVNWASYGLGLATDLGPEIDGIEVVDMCIWLIPAQFGLLTDEERKVLEASGTNPETFIELWNFKIVDDKLADAEPVLERESYLSGELVELPFYLSFFKKDHLKEAQRSFMELMRGFQRFSSAMYNIYVAGMRKNVWGLKIADGSAVDTTSIKDGDVTGLLLSKQQGRDVRTVLADVSTGSGVDQTLQGVDSALNMKDRFFPAQAMPAAVAGIDRAVKSQVTSVVQGSQRSMRTLLRDVDSGLLLPSRMGGYRNLKRFDNSGIEQLTDEDVATLMGSGIESMEAERVSEVLWQLLYAIIQNQEANAQYDVAKMLGYLGRVGNLSVDLSEFVKQQPEQAPPVDPAAAGAEVIPGADGQPAVM